MNVATISPQQLADRLRSGQPMKLVDVRTPAEFREFHIASATNLPLDQIDARSIANGRNGSASPIYVLCRSGSRGRQACEKLVQAGVSDVFNVEGGTLACVDAGLSVVRGRKTISLERQVRIAAGMLVLLGVGLGWWIHPAFFGLSAFVGVGLIFAGITDTCGMGLMLARMPWNR